MEKSTYIRSEYQCSVFEHPCSVSKHPCSVSKQKKKHVTIHPEYKVISTALTLMVFKLLLYLSSPNFPSDSAVLFLT